MMLDEIVTSKTMRVVPKEKCMICNLSGVIKHSNLRDFLFGAPGIWKIRSCSSCGLLWLDPAPIPDDLYLAYRNYHTHKDTMAEKSFLTEIFLVTSRAYLDRHFGYNSGPKAMIGRILSYFLHIHPGMRETIAHRAMYLRYSQKKENLLLDVGCGSGERALFLQSLGWQVIGVETDDVAAETARRKGIDVRQGTIEEIKFEANSFDAVTLNHVIEHVSHPLTLLTECRRILRNGGKIVIVTPNAAGMGHRIFGSKWRGLEPPRHLQIFTSDSLLDIAHKAGFKNILIRSTILGADWYLKTTFERITSPGIANILKNMGAVFIFGQIYQLVQWTLQKFYSEAGEEIILMGDKL